MQKNILKDFPNLNEEQNWGFIQSKFEVVSKISDHDLISNVSIIPFVGNKCLIIRLDNGLWELPGGTLEPNENYLRAIKRELLEEAGAALVDFNVFGVFSCFSKAEKPYRPHIPHPHFLRCIGYGNVRVVDNPTNPADGENVVSVETVSIEEAENRFKQIGREDIAQLYRLAACIRNKLSRGGVQK